jgi:hypothetical protein
MTEFSRSTGESRLRISPDLLGGPATRRVFGESRLSGRLLYEQQVKANVEYLQGLQAMASDAGSYRHLLSGESSYSEPPQGQSIISDKRVFKELGALDRTYLTFGAALAGPDYTDLKRSHPNERFKFYSSFDLTSPAKAELGTQWLADVAGRAHAQGLSLTTKSFDHAYDSLNLYTWHPAELAAIVTDLYPTYAAQGLYNATPHFLQGSLPGVNPDHIGFAQEPVTGWPPEVGLSHSARMGALGGMIDEHLGAGQALDAQLYTEAAMAVGVNPAQPYLIVQ